jgi:hypothetical protein
MFYIINRHIEVNMTDATINPHTLTGTRKRNKRNRPALKLVSMSFTLPAVLAERISQVAAARAFNNKSIVATEALCDYFDITIDDPESEHV